MSDNDDDRVPMATIAPKSEPQVHWMPEPSSRFYDAAQKALRDAYAMGKQEGEIELVRLRKVVDAAKRARDLGYPGDALDWLTDALAELEK